MMSGIPATVVDARSIAVSNGTPNTAWGSPGLGGASSWSIVALAAATDVGPLLPAVLTVFAVLALLSS